MSAVNAINTVALRGGQSIELKKPQSLEAQKEKLMKAAKEMESVFLYQLIKTMRKTVPESGFSAQGGFGGGMGKDVYTQMFDQEIAVKMSGHGDRSIASMLYREMENILEKQHGIVDKAEMNFELPIRSNNFHNINRSELRPRFEPDYHDKKTNDPISKFDNQIDRAAKKYRLSPELIKSVIKAESNGDPNAVSSAGAKGLMQLADTTASDMGVTDVFDTTQNIDGGSKYLRKMIDRFGDLKTALAAYNAGPATVDKYGGIPPYRETQNYIRSILKDLTGQLRSGRGSAD